MKKINNKKEVDIENLNDVILTSKKILKVLFVVLILACVFLGLLVFTKLSIGKILLNILEVVSPLFIGYVIAWLLNPLVKRLEKRKVKRGLASVFVFVMFLVIIYIIIKIMIPLLYKQINEFLGIVPTLFLDLGNFIHETFNKLTSTGIDFSSVEETIYDGIEAFGGNLTTKLPTYIISSVSSVISSVWSVLLGLVIGFYLLIDFESMKKIYNIVPKKNQKTIKKIMEEIDITCKNFVQGTLFISLIVAVLTSIFFAIIGLPSPMLFGLICGITNIIPYIGPWLGGAIATIVGFTVSPLVGILTVIIAFTAQQIDGIILQPIIMSKTMKLHPVTIMIGLLVFGYFFGVIGMIVATPVIACLKIIIMYWNDKYKLKDKIINS